MSHLKKKEREKEYQYKKNLHRLSVKMNQSSDQKNYTKEEVQKKIWVLLVVVMTKSSTGVSLINLHHFAWIYLEKVLCLLKHLAYLSMFYLKKIWVTKVVKMVKMKKKIQKIKNQKSKIKNL